MGKDPILFDLVIKFLILISRLPESLAIRQHPRHTFPFICRQEARMGARYRLSRTNWLPLAIDVQLKQELVKICIRTAPWNTSIENSCCSSSTLHIVHYSFSTWIFFWCAVSSQKTPHRYAPSNPFWTWFPVKNSLHLLSQWCNIR